jgi:molecular chaperone GrpE
LRDFWQKKGKKVLDKDTNISMQRDEGSGDPEPSMDVRNAQPDSPDNDPETAKLLSELDDLRQTLLRRQADFDNYRKRIEKERTEDSKRATARLIEGLIPIIDGFEHALAAHREKEYEVYSKGFELIYKQLIDNLTKLGAERVNPIGKQFDPHLHQAMDRLETTDHEDGTIVQVFQPGYVFHGRVLRPAMVRVAVNGAAASKKTVN